MVTRWWVVLCAALLWDTVSLQTDNGHRECCPCPKDALGFPVPDADGFASDLEAAGSAGAAARAAAAGLGDCPCRFRGADSEGAPSVFFPNAVRAVRPFVNLEDSKENPDPLLHPEVNLASSVLETLRKATDEEYEEALARDAARSAADGEAAESARNLVTVIINPKDAITDDDVMSEASHVHEARCINPLGRSSLRTSPYKPVLLTDILNLPKRTSPSFRSWNLFDMDNGMGASNVNERVVEPDFKKDGVEFTPQSSSDVKPLSPLEKLNLKIPRINLNNGRTSFNAQPSIPKPRTPTKIEISSLSSLIPKFKSPSLLQRKEDDGMAFPSDNQNAASIFKERYTGFAKKDSEDDNIMVPRPIQTTTRPKEATKIEISSLSDILSKLNTPNLLRRNEKEDHSNFLDITSTESIINEQNSGFDSKNDPAIIAKPIETNTRPRTAAKLEIPSISNLLPKINTPNFLRSNEDEDLSTDTDNQNAASIIKERYTGFAKDDTKNEENVLKETVQTTVRPSFKNSPTINLGLKPISNGLKFGHPENRDAATDLLNNLLKGLQVPNLSDLFGSDIFNLRNNDQLTKSTEQEESVPTMSEVKPFHTEILDTVPSPSEIKADHVGFNEVKQQDTENEEIQKNIERNPMKTEIIDHIPNSSDFAENNDGKLNTLADPEVKPKVNTVAHDSNEKSELNNEMEQLNEDIIDDTIISEFDRESQLKNVAPLEEPEFNTSNDMFDIDPSQLTSIDEPKVETNQRNELDVDDSVNESKSLPLRERIKIGLENLKRRSKINQNLLKSDKLETEPTIDDDISKNLELVNSGEQVASESQNEELEQLNTKILDSLPSKEDVGGVNIADLQQMSDSLLDKERVREDPLSEDNDTEENMNDLENDSRGSINDGDIASSTDNAMEETNNLNSVNSINNNNDNVIECFEKGTLIKTFTSKNDLPDNLKDNAKDSEMASEASERVTTVDLDNKLRSPLRQSILQPTSLSDLNLFNLQPLDISDVLNINNPLPVFKLTDIFNARENTDDNSLRGDETDDPDSIQSMSPSTSSFRSALPPLRPLEDINLDILQLKPLGSELPTIPRLNLNSFKTKLAIPETLQLRPLVLESSVGNKKGVIGASLTFGNDNKKGMGRSSMLEQASLKKPSILGRPLGTLPSLDDLRNTMLENAHNLFNTPFETTSRNAVEDTFRSGQVLSENLRVGAENTMKHLQQNLESTFKGVGLNNGLLSSSPSYRSPNDLFEEISRKHDDVNDKLKGISYDLSDRLETLRNNIFEDYRIPSLGSNIFDRMSLLGSPMPKQSSLTKSKSKSSNFSSKGRKAGSDIGTKGKFISRSSADKNKLKMPSAASRTSLKTVKSPSSRTAESPIFKGLRKESTRPQLLQRERPTLSLFQKPEKNTIDTTRPLLKKPALPKLGQSNVKITFSTTPLPPILTNKSRFKDFTKSKTVSAKGPFVLPTLPRSNPREKGGLLSSLRDSSGFASEPVSSKIKAPFKSQQGIKDFKLPIHPKSALKSDDEELTVFNKTSKLKTDLPKLLGSKAPTLDKVFASKPGQLKPDGIVKSKSPLIVSSSDDKVTNQPSRNQRVLSWPKTIDDNFLLKVREALRARLAGINQNLNANTIGRNSNVNLTSNQAKNTGDEDMARSASNNVDVTEVGPQIMKENTSYTCKMMCTKNS